MNLTYLKQNNAPQLLLIYAGWSTDPSAFAALQCSGYDIAVAWDYSELHELALPYDEVVVIAWSLGVHAAELTAANLPLTLTIAVNGTSTPVSDTEGIPAAIFQATAEQLSEQTLCKFRRRMGAASLPRGERSIESLRQELLHFPLQAAAFRWDRAVISSGDMIFPPANQKNAWAGKTEMILIEGKHYPDFQRIIDAFVINKPLVGQRFGARRHTYDSEADVQHRIADHLFQLWQKHGIGASALEIGVGSGYFTNLYAKTVKNLTLWDLAPGSDNVMQADAEKELLKVAAHSFDAIASASTMQWFNSPAAFMHQVERVLKPGGLAVLSTFGVRTFEELTQAGVVPLPYLSEESLRRIIPAGMKVLELHDGLITKVFKTPLDALHHLQATGVNARPTLCPLREVIANYPQRNDGRYSLTYQPIYLILQK